MKSYVKECGELSLEDAEIINDVAYDRYVNEANVYDKLVDRHVDALNASQRRRQKIAGTMGDYDRDSTQYKTLNKVYTREKERGEKHKYPSSLSVSQGGSIKVTPTELKDKRLNDTNRYSRTSNDHITRKREWMKFHGNVGQTPEERYKAGRYNFN